MKMYWVCILGLLLGQATAQRGDHRITPKVTTLTIEEGAVTELRLSPGYTTSVRVPEEIRSVVLGNPATFKAEYSEAEPSLLFLKPITAQPAETNVLITTKSGQEISLQLVSDRKNAKDSRVDFVVEYRRRQMSVLIQPAQFSTFLVSEDGVQTQGNVVSGSNALRDLPSMLLAREASIANPGWQGNDLEIAVGELREDGATSVLSFSLRNHSDHPMDVLPPQLELSGATKAKHGKTIKSEPVALEDVRISARKLPAGGRADGVIVFTRPAFKESKERLVLEVAAADQVDRPVMALVPFNAPASEGQR